MAKIDGLIIPPELLKESSLSLKKNAKTIKFATDSDDEEPTDFVKSILNELNGSKNSIHRLAFTTNPNHTTSFSGLYKPRLRLLPPYVLKRIAIQDDLVAAIIQARQNHVSAFGRPRPNRFSNGFTIEPKQIALAAIEAEKDESLKVQKKDELRKRINDATKMILNCGHTSGWDENDRLSFPQYLSQSVRNMLVCGMLATEVIWRDLNNGCKKFYGFRVIDAGTIYRASPYSEMAESIREQSRKMLEQVKNEKLIPERFERDEYAWIQVVDGRPVQAFTGQECLVHMLYGVPDIEMDGYPVTPIDTVIAAITTHINITTHNKLYFQYGRASRGMLVFTSDDVEERVLRNIKQQFNACLVGETSIITKEYGMSTISHILQNNLEQKVTIWTGKDWKSGLVYKTGQRKLTKTKLANCLEIETSPDHKFLVAGENGVIWKEQKDLQLRDFVAVNANPFPVTSETAEQLTVDYNFEPIVEIKRFDNEVEMFDVEVYDTEHRFSANGIITHNSINSSSNSFRMPVFSVGQGEDLKWQPIDSTSKDMEFQYLMDMNARVILSAFMMSPEELPGWSYLSRGTNSQALCLDPSSKIFTNHGLMEIGELIKQNKHNGFMVWTGKNWSECKAFYTGKRNAKKVFTNNGMDITTSPDHRFMAIGDGGVPQWKNQSELKEGDFLLINKKSVNCKDDDSVPSYNGQKLNEEMMEVLGWLTGDGNINIRFNKNTGNWKQASLSFFYHHEKEIDIWKNHYRILKDFGLNHKHIDHVVTEKEAEDLRIRKGVQSVAPNRLRNMVYDTNFVRWMFSLGFTSSTDGKTIPPFVHTLPESYRTSFLKGFFSADGTRSKTGAIRITIHDNRLRRQTKELLLGLGIRTQRHEGLFKNDFGYGCRPRVKTEASTVLNIKDKTRFFEKVGFIQPHKQPLEGQLDRPMVWEKIPNQTMELFIKQIIDSDNNNKFLNVHERGNLLTVLNPNADRNVSAPTLKSFMERGGVVVPNWLNDYYFEKIIKIEDLNKQIEMVDLTVFDSDHAFMANGIVVHNSENNNEFKMLAARDVGIRPLLLSVEDFLNSSILPLIDPVLAEMAVVRLVGLEAETPERESIRLQQDMQVHLTMDEILEKVEKRAIGKRWGGEFLFNPNYQSILDRYFTVGEIKEVFFDRPGASRDPRLDYFRDAFFFQQQQLLQAEKQMVLQLQMQQQQALQGASDPSQETPQGSEEVAQPEEEAPAQADSNELSGALQSASDNLNGEKG